MTFHRVREPALRAELLRRLKPLTACPATSPLQFQVTYSLMSRKSTVRLPGFANLGPGAAN